MLLHHGYRCYIALAILVLKTTVICYPCATLNSKDKQGRL